MLGRTRVDTGGKKTDTYNSFYPDGTFAHGGYSSHIRALEHFTFPIPDGLESELAAPMLCAGLTAYSPLVRNGTGPGKKVGIVGMYVPLPSPSSIFTPLLTHLPL